MGGIATISGVALVPGVSANRRLYTPELISRAAKRMQERIADPDGLPIVMRTHHEAGDDSAKIVGRVTSVTVGEDKALRYKADLYDTFHGQQIAGLVTPDKPALRSVSIHGYWMGDTRQVQTEGGIATTADDLEIDAIDFTASPGVKGALIDSAGTKAAEAVGGRTPISESMEASVALSETSPVLAVVHEGEYVIQRGRQYELDRLKAAQWESNHGIRYKLDENGKMPQWLAVWEAKYSADQMKSMLAKGHAMKNASGEPSYPIADKSDLAKAIKAVERGKSGHDAIRKHIIKRAAALGASDMIPDNWNSDGSMKETTMRLGEVTEYYPDGPDGGVSFCIDIYAGPLCVTLRGAVGPDELRAAGAAAMQAALNAVQALDPDADADIDAVGMEGFANADFGPDDDMESVKAVNVTAEVSVLSSEDLARKVQEMSEALGVISEWRKEMLGKVADELNMNPADGHSHTHEMDGANHVHAHKHDHPDESGGDGYAHSHTHGHVHASTDGPDHDHGHNHIHTTSSSATAESTQEEESAVSETTKAAEAAPERNLTEADIAALGATIGESVGAQLAEALRAIAEQTAPKHAAAATAQETAVQAEQTDTAESATENADEVAALKESVAALKEALVTQGKNLRDEMRAEILAEKGLPPRRGYRIAENEGEEEQLSNAELFDKYRADILLGGYAITPSPQA